MTDWYYTVQVLSPDDTVVETHVIRGSMEASEYLEERLKEYPANYWGRIAAKDGERTWKG